MKTSVESLKQLIEKRVEAEKLLPRVPEAAEAEATNDDGFLPAFISRFYCQSLPKDQNVTPFTIRLNL